MRTALRRACDGIETAYYLVHSMSASSDFSRRDRQAAENFGRAARACGVRRIVYLGGLGGNGADLSPHLRSRHEVGDVLRASGVPVVEFRAAMIIGSGSISFEMMRYLTERLPLMIAPRWCDDALSADCRSRRLSVSGCGVVARAGARNL